MTRVRTGRTRVRWVLFAGLVAALALGTVLWWRAAPPPATPLAFLLPRGSAVTSQARVELDGRPPFEIAATVFIPPFPGASADRAHALLAGYDRWRHRWRVLFLAPLSSIAQALEAGPLLGAREAVVFPTFGDDGLVHYRVVGLRFGRAFVFHEGVTAGRVEVRRGVLVERDPRRARGLRWNGRAFEPVAAPPAIPPPIVWRYWFTRFGEVHADTTTLLVTTGQVVRLARLGGGPIVVPIPDANLDLVNQGYRARRPGVYFITIPDFKERRSPFRLTMRVVDGDS